MFFMDPARLDILHLKIQIAAALFLTLTGLVSARVHLGNPGAGVHALKNYKHSWLSREVFTVSLFSGKGRTGSKIATPLSPVFQSCGLVLWTVAVLLPGGPGLEPVLLFAAAAFVIGGEIAQRHRFYATYRRVGL